MIKIPGNLDSVIKDKVSKSYNETIKTCGDSEFQYVLKKFPTFAKRLSKSRGHKKSLIRVSKVFYNACYEGFQSTINLNNKTKKEIISALFYVVNPFDIIPDHTPGTGYFDDCYVVNLCLKKIKRSSPDLYNLALSAIEGD